MRDGWQQVTLGDVAKVVGGGTPKTSVPEYWGGDIPWITPTEVTAQDGQVVYRTERTLTDLGLSKSGAKLLPVGTVLLTSRATIGAAVLAGAPIATNQGFASLICGPEALPEFVMHWCRHNKERFIERAGGNTFLEVAKGKVASVPIDLPPLDEQRRIVDLIDSLDATIDAADRLVEEASVLYRSMLVERAGSLGDLRSVGGVGRACQGRRDSQSEASGLLRRIRPVGEVWRGGSRAGAGGGGVDHRSWPGIVFGICRASGVGGGRHVRSNGGHRRDVGD